VTAEHPEYPGWVRYLTDNPLDFMARLVFADWLDDRGDPRAPGWRFCAHRLLAPTLSRDYHTYEWGHSETGGSGRGVLRHRLYMAVYAAEPFAGRPRPDEPESINGFAARLEVYYSVPEHRVAWFPALDAVARAYHTIEPRFRGLL